MEYSAAASVLIIPQGVDFVNTTNNLKSSTVNENFLYNTTTVQVIVIKIASECYLHALYVYLVKNVIRRKNNPVPIALLFDCTTKSIALNTINNIALAALYCKNYNTEIITIN